ncbi:hypothetical protein BDN72DRAFT_840932 [Pluteus cervinus]|uniref:Uncharacterized protein n=1 Tax=Pluteus cervinus TaxID=181527 RepID=A0ACD3AUF6_9AGAR|nr:hypothetical protein BDN72DRAFT_840932 [Pluteus cervinus]
MSTPTINSSVSLTASIQSRISNLIEANNEESFNEAFDALYAPTLSNISYNGAVISRDAYKQELGALYSIGTGSRASAAVTFQEVFEVVGGSDNSGDSIAIFFTVIINRKFLIRAAPAQTKVSTSLNAQVTNETGSDLGRISTVNHIALAAPVPVNLLPTLGSNA